MISTSQEPKILIWDIETAPNWGWYYDLWKEGNIIQEGAPWYILSVAYKWLGDKRTHVATLPGYERYAADPEDDYELAKLAHELFDAADIIVAHNGISFDSRKAQARMAIHGFGPPSPYKEVDTLRVARRHFAFNSNRLGDLCKVLGIGDKLDSGGKDTWLGCMRGDPKSWARMAKYNRHDVEILEQLYLRLRPWMPRHPNMAALAGRPEACPKCNVEGQMEARGWQVTSATRRRRFQCRACGGWSSARVSERTENNYAA